MTSIGRPASFVLMAFAALFMLLCHAAGTSAAGKDDIARTVQNIDRYAMGLKLNMTFEEAASVLGQPREKKAAPGQSAGAYAAAWAVEGRTLNAQFGKDNRITSYSVHWFAKAGTAPEFNAVFSGDFKEESARGMRHASVEGEGVAISWTKTPVANLGKVIDVLTVRQAGSLLRK